jgi:hypothetical protein
MDYLLIDKSKHWTEAWTSMATCLNSYGHQRQPQQVLCVYRWIRQSAEPHRGTDAAVLTHEVLMTAIG